MQIRKTITFITMLSVTIGLFSQETITAEKEILGEIPIGDKEDEIKYDSNEEGFFSPAGPFVDGNGILYFFPTYKRDSLLAYRDNKLNSSPLTKNISDYEKLKSTGYVFTSQQGTISVPGNGLTFNYYNNNFRSPSFRWGDKKTRSDDYITTPVPNGMFLESRLKNVLLVAEFLNNGNIEIHDQKSSKTWLPTQKGGFSIGEDGLLYRNGMVWSAQQPEGGAYAYKYIGRLISGHQVWAGWESENSLRYITISNSKRQIEMIVEIPWATNYTKKIYRPYNYGLGPWGELYCLIPPEPKYKTMRDSTYPYWDSGEAELAVVRNHLKYFGRLSEDRVRLRKGPSTSTESLGTYPIKTGFRILEKGKTEETISGQTDVWYKVRLLDGTEGWFFGAFVHNLYDGPNGNPPPWPNVADW